MRVSVQIAERPGPHRPGVWAGFLVPDPVIAAIAGSSAKTRNRLPVKVAVGDEVYASSLTRRPDGWEFIASLEFRRRTGSNLGETIDVDISLDTDERRVHLPVDVEQALKEARLSAWFDGKVYSHQREYLLWVDDAKKPETRARRIHALVERGREEQAAG